jgi:hypothetical protein
MKANGKITPPLPTSIITYKTTTASQQAKPERDNNVNTTRRTKKNAN